MREEKLPAMITPKSFQAHQAFVASRRPELTWSFEATLILTASRFDGSTAQRFTQLDALAVGQAFKVGSEIVNFTL